MGKQRPLSPPRLAGLFPKGGRTPYRVLAQDHRPRGSLSSRGPHTVAEGRSAGSEAPPEEGAADKLPLTDGAQRFAAGKATRSPDGQKRAETSPETRFSTVTDPRPPPPAASALRRACAEARVTFAPPPPPPRARARFPSTTPHGRARAGGGGRGVARGGGGGASMRARRWRRWRRRRLPPAV